MHTLEADSIQLSFGLRRILTDIYISGQTGNITGLLGRNGQGKSCLMNIMYGSLRVQDKSVRFDGISLQYPYRRPDLITFLPQFHFIPAPLRLKRIFSDFGLSYDVFEKYFPEFRNRERNSLGSLSGGQRRLVETYAIICSPSKFSLLDEPFSHLMPLHIEVIQEVLEKEKQRKGFLITDHVFQQVMDVSDALYMLTDGKTHPVKTEEDMQRLGYLR